MTEKYDSVTDCDVGMTECGVGVTGLHVAVGLTGTLRLHHMLFDTLRLLTEVRVRRCGSCCFSPGGSILAAADGHLVVLTSTITLKKLHTLKGHSAKVNNTCHTLQVKIQKKVFLDFP